MILEERTRLTEVDDTLRVQDNRVYRGTVCIAGNDDAEWARMARWAAQIVRRPPGQLAMLGLGMGILPKLLPPTWDVAIFELERAVAAAFAPPGATVILGDFRETLSGSWDVIANDTGVAGFDFGPFLREGGLLLEG